MIPVSVVNAKKTSQRQINRLHVHGMIIHIITVRPRIAAERFICLKFKVHRNLMNLTLSVQQTMLESFAWKNEV